jgi:CHRD domain
MRLRRLALFTAAATALTLVLPGVAFAPRNPLFAALNGKNQIAQDGERGAGDPNGAGSFSAVIKDNGLAVRDIEAPIEAHIHRGGKNRNGPDVVPLTAPEAGDPGNSSNCTTLDSNLIGQIRRNPRKFYVKVNTGEFRDGAIRGQLFSRGGP